MKKYLLSTAAIIIALIFNSCELVENIFPEEELSGEEILIPTAQDLIYAEEAFPGSIGDSTTIAFNGEVITCTKINGEYVYQGDIIVTPSSFKSAKGAGLESTSKMWPKGIVYFTVSDDLPNKIRVTNAISHWEDNTEIEFEERTDEDNYIEFKWDDKGCSSFLGMKGGKQKIRIADWAVDGNVIHEIGHALGLVHEQSKQNRNDHVKIIWKNIPILKRNNFVISKKSINTEGFDFGSIMLYNSYAFTKNGDATITKLDNTTFSSQRNALSKLDIEIISKMYSTKGLKYKNYGVTTEIHKDNSNWEEIIYKEFGDEYRVADWKDLEKFNDNGGDLIDLFDGLGLNKYGSSAFVTRNGSHNYSSTRFYFVSRHEHNKPRNYLAHDNINNYLISLGSWYTTKKILVIKK